jgi:hypothetical protein
VIEAVGRKANRPGAQVGLQHRLESGVQGHVAALVALARHREPSLTGGPSRQGRVRATASPRRMPVTAKVATRAVSRSGQGLRDVGSDVAAVARSWRGTSGPRMTLTGPRPGRVQRSRCSLLVGGTDGLAQDGAEFVACDFARIAEVDLMVLAIEWTTR